MDFFSNKFDLIWFKLWFFVSPQVEIFKQNHCWCHCLGSVDWTFATLLFLIVVLGYLQPRPSRLIHFFPFKLNNQKKFTFILSNVIQKEKSIVDIFVGFYVLANSSMVDNPNHTCWKGLRERAVKLSKVVLHPCLWHQSHLQFCWISKNCPFVVMIRSSSPSTICQTYRNQRDIISTLFAPNCALLHTPIPTMQNKSIVASLIWFLQVLMWRR